MVLTPIFRLEQSLTTLTVHIHAPMAKLSDMEVCVEDDIFYFSASPYFLKFEIPGSVKTDENSFDLKFIDGDVTVVLEKTDSIHFENLGLITKLLVNSNKNLVSKPRIISLDSDNNEQKNWKMSWFNEFDESVDDTDHINIGLRDSGYGFAGSRSGLFLEESDLTHIVDLPDPDHTSILSRRKLKESQEEDHFSNDHYLVDYFETEFWAPLLLIKLPWSKHDDEDAVSAPNLSKEELHLLTNLSSRTLPPITTEYEEISIYLGMLDILFAYAYDYRVREGEEMTESGWNIAKLSATLSWLQVFHNLPSVLISFYRRALCYPLVRNWKFCNSIKRDIVELLQHKNAKEWCLAAMLEVRKLLIAYPGYHAFVELYINDYLVWIQLRCRTSNLHSLGEKLSEYKLNKSDVGYPLKKLEQLGLDCLQAEEAQGVLDQLKLDN